MELTTVYALVSVTLISLVSLVGVTIISLNEKFLRKNMFLLVSLAVGALFGNTFIFLIPEAYGTFDNIPAIPLLILTGIVMSFILEKFLLWRHEHGHGGTENHHDEEIKLTEKQGGNIKPVGILILVSDGVHNFIDGIIIGATYLISIEVGIATTIAVILHEIPQEISDFGILLHAGFSKAKALFLNFLSAITAILGTLIALFLGTAIEAFIPAIAAIAAGSFLYIAGSDLVPELHKTSDFKRSTQQLAAILVGIALMFALLLLE